MGDGQLLLFVSEIEFMNIAVHLLNSVYVIIDIWVIAIPIRLLHFWHTEVYGMIYLVFTLIHWGAGGAPIYPILDYSNDPALAAISVSILTILGVPLCQGFLFSCYWIRLFLYKRCCSAKTGSLDLSTTDSTAYANDAFEQKEVQPN